MWITGKTLWKKFLGGLEFSTRFPHGGGVFGGIFPHDFHMDPLIYPHVDKMWITSKSMWKTDGGYVEKSFYLKRGCG